MTPSMGLPALFLLFILFAPALPAGLAAEETAPSAASEDEPDWTDEELLLMEGEGLTVVAAEETTQQIRRIKREEIERLNAPDLTALLEKAFHISVSRNGPYGSTTGISLRGFGSGRVAVLIDGVPVNSAQTGVFELGKIDMNTVEEIEVIYGGSDTKYNYNGAVGGVVNIITKRRSKPGTRLHGGISNLFYLPEPYYDGTNRAFPPAADLFDTQKLNLGIDAGREGYSWKTDLSVNRAMNHFLYKDSDNKTRRRQDSDVQDAGLASSVLFDLPDSSRLILSGDFYYGDKNLAGPVSSTTTAEQKDSLAKGSVFLDLNSVGRDEIDTEIVGSYSFDSTDYEDPSAHDVQNLHTASLINRWGFYVDENLFLRAGGDFSYSFLDSTNLGRIDGFAGGAFLTAEYSLRRDFRVIPSLKLVAADDSPIPVPKLGLVWDLSENLSVKNNWFRTFKLPTFNELYWPEDAFAAGNPDLKPEDGFGGDLVVRYRKPQAFTAEASVYTTYQTDAILWQPSEGKWRPENIGKALYLGSDTSVKSSFHPQVSLTLSYSFLLTYVLSGDLGFEDDKRMPYKPVHTFGLGIETLWKTGSLRITEHYESVRYTSTLNITELDPFLTVDIDLLQRLGVQTLFISARNVFGASYVSVDGYLMPGCSVSVGMRWDYETL